MSNLEHMLDKIRSDAEQTAQEILREAEDQATAICDRAEAAAKEEAEARLSHARQQATLTRERLGAGVERQARDLVLSARQSVIERVFDLAADQLKQMQPEALKAIIADYLKAHPIDADTTLVLPEGQQAAAPDGVKVTTDAQLAAGFKVVRQGITENHDYVELMHFLKDDLTVSVVERLKQVQYEA